MFLLNFSSFSMNNNRIIRPFFFVSLFLLLNTTIYAQQGDIQVTGFMETAPAENFCVLEPLEYDDHFRYAPYPSRFRTSATGGGASFEITFNNNCNGAEWPEEAKEAFEYAVELWGNHLDSEVPITVEANWRALGSNTLGSARPTRFIFLEPNDRIFGNTGYPIAQANALVGFDVRDVLDIGTPFDIEVNISCERNDWYLGTDANTPSGRFDLVTVLLHEIGHGIGFVGTGSANNNNQQGTWGLGSPPDIVPIVYDQFVIEGGFNNVIDEDVYPNPSTDLYQVLTGQNDGLFFDGGEAELTIGGLRVPLFAPNPFQPGSSYSHLDQNFFSTFGPHAENALMRPAIPFQFAIHSPGPVFCGMLKEMAWPLGPVCEMLIEDDGPLSRPLLALPGNRVKDISTTPQLVWNDVSGASSYDIQVSRDFDHNNRIINQNVSGTSFTLPVELDNSRIHFWRVRARGAAGTGNWSSNFRFTTVVGLPNAVTLSSPQNGAINVRPGFEMRWQEIVAADSYQLQVAKTSDFSEPVIDTQRTTNSFSGTQNLDFSTQYFWRVRASNVSGTTNWSDVWSFTTIIERPEVVTSVISPVNDQMQVPVLTEFRWEASERASDYIVQVSKNENFSTLPVSGLVSSPQFLNQTPLEYAEVYYWRVKATNIGGESDWSDVNRFVTEVQETKISDNFPNPFNTSTTLRYQLSSQSTVLVDVYDMGGRRVSVLVNGEQAPGVYFETLHANHFASGIYLVRFIAGDTMDVQRITVIK